MADHTASAVNSLMTGVKSEVRGVLSMMTSWKTEKASRTVIPSDTFSPLSGGSRKTASEMLSTNIEGQMMLIK